MVRTVHMKTGCQRQRKRRPKGENQTKRNENRKTCFPRMICDISIYGKKQSTESFPSVSLSNLAEVLAWWLLEK